MTQPRTLIGKALSTFIILFAIVLPLEAQEQIQLSPGVYRTKIVLPDGLEHRRPEFEATVQRAQERLYRFAQRYHWEHLLEEPLLREVRLFDSKTAYDEFLRTLFPEAKTMDIPKTFTAGFQDDVFFAVSPELYAKLVPKMVEPDFYEKLICHELAHRFHTRLVNGNEEMMGPIWFWEGFATLVSGQFEHNTKSLDQKQLRELLESKVRGDYHQYNATVKHFLQVVPLPELVRRSYQNNFSEWLLENANPLPPDSL